MRTLFLTLALLCACVDRTPPLFVLRVGLDDAVDSSTGWNADQRREVSNYLDVGLDAWGVDFQLVPPGEAEVVVRAADLSASGACGRYTRGAAYVEVDPECAQGFTGLQKAAAHELGHWVLDRHWHYLGHICRFAVNEPPPPGCHPTIICLASGCLMEPGLRGPVTEIGEDYVDTFADPTPTDADRELLRRCVERGRCE